MKDNGLLEYWYHALRTARGIVLAVSDPVRAKQVLYQARAKSADPTLTDLQIRTSPVSPDEIWIVRGKPEKPEEAENDSTP